MDNTYKNHQVLAQLSEYADFYKSLSFSICRFITQGTNSTIFNIDSYVYSSMQGTLESIKDILIKGRMNDAYALLRKYYDSTIINIYTNLYLNDNFNIDNFIVEKIDNWINGKEQLPEYRVMSQYINQSSKLSEINELLRKGDNTYKSIRDRCNDHIHYNLYQHILYNDNEIYIENRLEALNIFSNDLKNIFVMHFSYLFYLNDHYMMSSDYVDSLDCGMTPEEGSQHEVAPFIKNIFEDVIKKSRLDLAETIINNTSMKLV